LPPAYGAVAFNCVDTISGKAQVGNYSPLTNKFNNTQDYQRYISKGSSTIVCSNMDNYFAGTGDVNTIYGYAKWGYIYRYYNGKWQAKPANMNVYQRS